MSSNIKFISYLATIEAEFLQKSSAFLGQVLHYHTLDANLQRKKPYNIMVFLLSSFPFYFTWNWKRSTFCQLEPSRARMYQALQTWSGREVFRISTFIERKLIQIFIFSFIYTRWNKLRFKNKLNITGKWNNERRLQAKCDHLGGSAQRHHVKEGEHPEEELLGQHLVDGGRVVGEVGEHLRGGAHKCLIVKISIVLIANIQTSWE